MAERILTQEEVQLLINSTTNGRDRTIIRLLYFAGLRVSELCGLKWRDLKARGDSDVVRGDRIARITLYIKLCCKFKILSSYTIANSFIS
nr:tyrosine-type recombinase/integrase [Nostoc sp. CHAB 5715]